MLFRSYQLYRNAPKLTLEFPKSTPDRSDTEPRPTRNGPQTDPEWSPDRSEMEPRPIRIGFQTDPNWTPDRSGMEPRSIPDRPQNGKLQPLLLAGCPPAGALFSWGKRPQKKTQALLLALCPPAWAFFLGKNGPRKNTTSVAS